MSQAFGRKFAFACFISQDGRMLQARVRVRDGKLRRSPRHELDFSQNVKMPYARARLRAEMLGTYTRENNLKPTIQAHVMQEREFKSKYEDAPHDKEHDFELHTR